MARASVLKLVDSLPFRVFEDERLLAGNSKPHSLHGIMPDSSGPHPDLVAHIIENYTEKNELIVDPFCGLGTIALEACLRGRQIYASDISSLKVEVAQAKLSPADIAEVTLKAQMLGLQRPVSTDAFNEYFSAFYDLRTFCELSNLRRAVAAAEDRVSRYVKILSMGLLHGHSAGFFSTYSNPYISLLPEEQVQLNDRRKQLPDYRPLVPRIIKRAALVGRDGFPSILQKMERESLVSVKDACNLGHINSASADFVFTKPPQLSDKDPVDSNWLRLWFGRFNGDLIRDAVFKSKSLDNWLDFMNGTFFEIARILKPGGRAAFIFPTKSGASIRLDEVLKEYIDTELYRFWEAESLLIARPSVECLENVRRARNSSKRAVEQRVLVLKRR